jgi:hypothetical protein
MSSHCSKPGAMAHAAAAALPKREIPAARVPRLERQADIP